MEMTIGSYRIAIERIPFSTAELRQRYDNLAFEWSKIVKKLGFANAYQRLFQQIKQDGYLAQLADSDATILDCGIGTADLSVALGKTLSQSLSIDGIDISANMLAQASKRLGQRGRLGRLHQANITQIPFSNQQFDLVMSAHTLEHLPSLDAGLQEMVRVAKPQGDLLIIVTQPNAWGRWIQLRWRIQLFETETLIAKLSALGLTQICSYSLSGSIWSWKGSVAIIGKVASPF